MKTKWDYTTLADSYLNRPDYSAAAVQGMLSIFGSQKGDKFCDVGAGVAHLTILLAKSGLQITAVEPNDAMRKNGQERTEHFENVTWCEGTGEETGQAANYFDSVTFGSSFNVCDRSLALVETARILRPRGWFSCMWNHRNLDDPIQQRIEEIIKSNISGYEYGIRREDQKEIINESGLFGPVIHLNSMIYHEQNIEECITAWRSHATLERQAGDAFAHIIDEISKFLLSIGDTSIKIPYTTSIWLSQLR